uniref:membrane-associated phosphatidylinositol transfer protein 2-like isoform X1 n=1 Tax=Styela clava TaxID=7725 RepID=UPI00193987B3|nr:membrane-associated phosphatidylinositol transfer protein 2-like isoform X1 [Styela clava]XP_039255473.1 membrane-associated phosphatidylinositol transfer protein 2-like isoform X1 [Styela clava]
MLIKEYRIPMPMTVEEYRIAQLYMIQKKSREESQGEGSGVEIIENRPYENGLGGSGQYTRKIYHISKHIPSWFVAILPKDALIVYEEAWNAYPHTRTRYTCPFIDKFSIDIETKYYDDPGDQENVFGTNSSKNIAVDLIDIVTDQLGDKILKEEDPRLYKSAKTGRGPLNEKWLANAKMNKGKDGHSVMCSYKLCKVEFKYWGMQSKIERFIHDVALRKTMGRAHRQAWCWQDEWFGLSMADIRRLEKETQAELEKKFGGDSSIDSDDGAGDSLAEKLPTQVPLSQVAKNGIKDEQPELVKRKSMEDMQGQVTTTRKKKLSRQTSSSSMWSNHSKASGKSTLSPTIAEWRMQSIEQHSDQSSDEDEFFDAIENFEISSNSGLNSLEKDRWGSVESLENELKREVEEEIVPVNDNGGNLESTITYQISVEEDSLAQSTSSFHLPETCKINTLFLVLHGGNPVDSSPDGAGSSSTKQADVGTLSSTFDSVVASHYKTAMGRFAFRLVSCPPVCVEACNALKNLSPTGYDSSSSHPFSSALVSAYATYSSQYSEAVNLTFASCNSVYNSFTLSEEGKGFNGQVCIIADSVGGLIAYDMLVCSPEGRRSNSTVGNKWGTSLAPHEEEDRHTSSNSLPSSPKFRFTHEEVEPMGGIPDPTPTDLDPLKVPVSRYRRYSANYCLDVQKNANTPIKPPHPLVNPQLSRRSSSGMSLDVNSRLDFEVADVFILGSPLGVILALRNSISGIQEPPLRPACGRIHNTFYLADPTSSRLEPLLDSRFSRIPVVDVARYHKFPLGDGRSLSLGESLTTNLHLFLESESKEKRRGSEWSVSSYNGEGINNANQGIACDQSSITHDHSAMECFHDDSDIQEDEVCSRVASRWFGDQRLDYALFCPDSLSTFPSVSLPHVFYASFWESTDLAAFIIRQVVHQENVSVCLDCETKLVTFTPSIPKEKWAKRRTHVKIRNMTSNHRAKDCVAIENGEQVLSGRFTYGPLDVVALTGEKVDIYINSMNSSQEWSLIATEVTDSHGKITCSVANDKRLPLGIFPVKMVVRGDLTIADSYLAVLPPHTDCVIFSIDGSFAASVSIMGSDPKVRPGSVDIVRHWQELGYLIIYVTARPDMQKHRVVTWLAHHNFPHGPVWFSDGLVHDPMKQKTNLLKHLQTECKLNYVGGYGSNKDITVYSQLGLTNEQIYIIGKASKKQITQCTWLSDGYSVHLREIKQTLKPAKYNAQIAMKKGCFGLPGHRNNSSKKRSSGKRGTLLTSSLKN